MKALMDKLLSLLRKTGRDDGDKNVIAALHEVIEQNGMEEDTVVPVWLLHFFDDIIAGRKTNGFKFIHRTSTEPDISSFMADLQDLIPAKWRDEGEYLEIEFPFGVTAIWWRMGDAYEIK